MIESWTQVRPMENMQTETQNGKLKKNEIYSWRDLLCHKKGKIQMVKSQRRESDWDKAVLEK